MLLKFQVSTTWNQSILDNKDAIARWQEAKNRLLENPPPTKSGILRRLTAASGGNLPTPRSSQRLMLLKASPRKALSSVSNILLDPDSHEAQQIVRRNKGTSVTSRSTSAVVLSSNQRNTLSDGKQNGGCKRGGDMHQLRSLPSIIVSPSKLRHKLFTEVIHILHHLIVMPCP